MIVRHRVRFDENKLQSARYLMEKILQNYNFEIKKK